MASYSKSHPYRIAALVAVALTVCALLSPLAYGFHRDLSPEQVREAYFIGRDQSHRAAFFAQYVHSPKLADTGPDVQLIEFRTPYEQVAERARDNQWSNYSPPDAEKDYESHPREVIVRFLIFETSTFDFPATEAHPDVGGFTFIVSQGEREVHYTKVTVEDAVPVPAGSLGSGGRDGLDIRLHFGSFQFAAGFPVTVGAIAPTGQRYSVTFDLASLK